jgi:preprotein translocase subunit SecF
MFGLNPSIEFTGGSIMEIEYQDARPSNDAIKESLSEFDLGDIIVQPSEDRGAILRIKDISEEKHQEILSKLKESHDLEEMRFESIGPVIGEELKQKTILIIVLSLLSIIAYVTFAFRKTQSSIKSWQYGIATLFALGHDVLIPIGAFAILGQYYGVEISIAVVVALLTVLGYSVNDTVVVFDRVRENLVRMRRNSLQEIVNKSLNDTLSRSINTSLTTLFVLFAIFFFGGATLQYFALALIIGILAGTYSSIFLASPIVLAWLNYKRSRE